MNRIAICHHKTNFLPLEVMLTENSNKKTYFKLLSRIYFLIKQCIFYGEKENGSVANADKLTEIMCCSKH